MNGNDIIILQAFLERIAVSLERIVRTLERPHAAPDQKVEPEQTPAPVQPEVVEQTPEPAQVEEPKPVVTADLIRKLVVTLCATDQATKDAVREIVTEYGRNVSAIPADKYPEVLDRLSALQEG